MENMHPVRLEEKKAHGSVLFPFNIYPCTIPGDFPSVSLHWQRSMEIIFVKKGSLLARLGMESRQVSAGQLCVVPPGTLHSLRSMDGARAEYENIIFDPEFLGSGGADVCARQYLVPLAAGQLLRPLFLDSRDEACAGILNCITGAERLCEMKQPGYELGVKAAMLGLVCGLVQLKPGQPAAEPPGTARLKQALDCIRRDYAQPLTVERMAAVCGCSPSHFMRWFRQMTGTSFVVYLNEYRLSAAARLLRSGEEKVLTIAHETGFESLSNFNRQFRRRYGVTPREYRSGK